MIDILYKSWSKILYRWYQILVDLMLFCQVWIARRAITSNLAKPQTFPLEKLRGSYRGLKCSLVFWMSLYKDYDISAHLIHVSDENNNYIRG